MNNLNSILIEGVLAKDALVSGEGVSALCTMTLASNRYFKDGGDTKKVTGFFEVEARGNLAEAARTHGTEGRGLRVVGRLAQEWQKTARGGKKSRVYIIAEHIEYRPEFKGRERSDEEVGYF